MTLNQLQKAVKAHGGHPAVLDLTMGASVAAHISNIRRRLASQRKALAKTAEGTPERSIIARNVDELNRTLTALGQLK